MTQNKTRKWIDVIGDIVRLYNETNHSSIKMAPNAVNHETAGTVWQSLYVDEIFRKLTQANSLSQGQLVRIMLNKDQNRKKAEKTFSPEVFYVATVNPTDPVTYNLRDTNGDSITGSFYTQELLPVERNRRLALPAC